MRNEARGTETQELLIRWHPPVAGRTAAILASLTSTCRRHDMDPKLYLTQLLMNLPQAKVKEIRLPVLLRHRSRDLYRCDSPGVSLTD